MKNLTGKYVLAFDTICTGWECVRDENNQPYLYDSFEEAEADIENEDNFVIKLKSLLKTEDYFLTGRTSLSQANHYRVRKTISNIKFKYLYRDAGNYKVHGEIIFSNPDKTSLLQIEKELRAKLVDGEFFNPDKLDLPRLIHFEFPYDINLDHHWNEFDSLEVSKDSPTDSRTISSFLNQLSSFNSLK